MAKMVNGQASVMNPNEFGRFDCSALLGEMKDMVRKLRNYGVEESEIAAVLHEEELLPELIIADDYRILIGENQKEVHMEPLVKAVYLLFLNHPEGILFKHLPDYREELTKIYLSLKPSGLTDRALQSIEDVTNPLLNSINEKCARIHRLFSLVLPQGVVRYYAILGKRGEPKKIDLVRANVSWKCKLPSSQGL